MRTLARAVGASVAGASFFAAAAAHADTGPVRALGQMFDESPTLTIVTSSVLVLSDAGFTTLDAIDARRGVDTSKAVATFEAVVATPQAIGFSLAPFFFDINRWRPTENLLLLLPSQIWTSMLATHGVWTTASTRLPPKDRLGVSALIGIDWAFTLTGVGCLSREIWYPMEVGIAGSVLTSITMSLSIERAVHDSAHKAEWGSLAAWSIVPLFYSVGSILGRLDNQGSRNYDRVDERRTATPRLVPYVVPEDGGASIGIAGATL